MSTPDEYEKLYAKIGEASSLWGSLEQALRSFVADLAMFQNREFDNPDDDSAFVTLITLLGHMEARQLIASAKVLAHWTAIEGFYGKAAKHLNHIDNELRTQRNRYMHDQWYIWGDKIGRIQSGSIISNEPATGRPKYVHHRDTRYDDIEATRKLAIDIRQAISDLDDLAHEVRQATEAKWPQEE